MPICEAMPELKAFGKYRKLDSGKIEFIAYCTHMQDEHGLPIPVVQTYVSFQKDKFAEILDALLPAKKEEP